MHCVRRLEANRQHIGETMNTIEAIVRPYKVDDINDADGKLGAEGVTATESIFRQFFGASSSRSDTHSAHGEC